MKKLKILPSILMLVLCVGVLAVGVFAITPTKNQITGSITINAVNEAVEITAYNVILDNNGNETSRTKIGDTVYSRAGTEIGLNSLQFETNNKNEVDEVSNINIVLSVKNTTREGLGVYFATSSNGEATATTAPIKLGGTPENGGNLITEMVQADFSGYTPIAVGLTKDVKITFSLLKFHTEKVVVDLSGFNISLNIEPVDTSVLGWSEVGTVGQTYNGYSEPWAGDDYSLVNVVIKEGVTGLGEFALAQCQNLENLILPDTLVNFNALDSLALGNKSKLNYNIDDNNPGLKYLGSFKNPFMMLISADSSITEINIHDKCEYIFTNAFNDCSNVTNNKLVLPDSIKYISTNALTGLTSLTEVSIPASINGFRTPIVDSNPFDICINFAITIRPGVVEKGFDVSSFVEIGEPTTGTKIGFYTQKNGTGEKIDLLTAGTVLQEPLTVYFHPYA